MKKIISFLVILLVLVSCSQGPTEEDYISFSSDFYTQMLIDGEQSEEVNQVYKIYTKEYSKFENDELHETLVSFYSGLNDGSATDHQLEAMKLLNGQ
jgi:hypothetical protein